MTNLRATIRLDAVAVAALLAATAACAARGATSNPIQNSGKTLVLPTKGAVTALALAPNLGSHLGGLYAAVDAPGSRTVIYHSTNGDTWTRMTILDRAGQVFGMVFWSPVEGFLLHGSGDASVLYKFDFGAGKRELEIAAKISGRYIRLVAEEPAGVDGSPRPVLILGSDAAGRGSILRTVDGVKLDSVASFESDPPALVAAYARHGGRVFLAGGANGRGQLYTGAFGAPFRRVPLDDVPNLLSLDFDAAGNGLAVGSRGELLHSSDSGLTWRATLSGSEADLAAVTFTGERTAYVCGRAGTVLYTSDAGLTVKPVHLGRREDFFALVPSEGGVHVVGAAGVVPFLAATNP